MWKNCAFKGLIFLFNGYIFCTENCGSGEIGIHAILRG